MKRITLLALALACAGVLVGTAVAVNSNAKQKGPLFQGAVPFCNLGIYFAQGTESRRSKFQLNFRDRPDAIRAQVKLKDALPNQVYYVRLIQGFSDCFHNDAAFVTNRNGRGKVTFIEPATSVASVLFICSTPFCLSRGSDFYASKPVFLHEGPGLRPLAPESGDATPLG